MITFITLPNSDSDYENIRINLEHVIEYNYNEETASIIFSMINGKERRLKLCNINPKKIMKRLDGLSKVVKLQIMKTDVK